MTLIRTTLLSLLLGFFAFTPALAGELDVNKYGLGQAGEKAGLKVGGTLPQYIGSIINVILSTVGLIFLILVIYGGFLWLTSAGNADKVAQGKTIIIWAVLGIVIITSAYLITSFVLTNVAVTP